MSFEYFTSTHYEMTYVVSNLFAEKLHMSLNETRMATTSKDVGVLLGENLTWNIGVDEKSSFCVSRLGNSPFLPWDHPCQCGMSGSFCYWKYAPKQMSMNTLSSTRGITTIQTITTLSLDSDIPKLASRKILHPRKRPTITNRITKAMNINCWNAFVRRAVHRLRSDVKLNVKCYQQTRNEI